MATVQLPPFASYPPANIRLEMAPDEWQACLSGWITLAEAHLRTAPEKFDRSKSEIISDVAVFLQSYFREHSRSTSKASADAKILQLHRLCFLLAHKQASAPALPEYICKVDFLTDFCKSYAATPPLTSVLQLIWKQGHAALTQDLKKLKIRLTTQLDGAGIDRHESELHRLLPLLQRLPNAAAQFMVGTEFLDTLASTYTKAKDPMRQTIAAFVYLCLMALVEGPSANHSSLSDHLHSLKTNAEAEQKKGEIPLLSDLVTNTALLRRIKDAMAESSPERAKNLESLLTPFRSQLVARQRPHKPTRRKADKGKARANDDAMEGEVHIHRLTLISQIQDLFPDLGAGFIMKLLNEYHEDVETVTAHLLDDSLPSHLRDADHSEALPTTLHASAPDFVPGLVPRTTPPVQEPALPNRRNVFDDDSFDRLAMDTSHVHLGKSRDLNAPSTTSKAAILSALASFDSDDDERDDTYDVEDVGALVSPIGAADADAEVDAQEEVLFAAWKASPEVFGRDAATRRSKPREDLRTKAGGMTDEAIEGWALMLARDPRKVRRLEAKYSIVGTFTGQQTTINRTAWRASGKPGAEESEAGEGLSRGGRGGRRGRGLRRGGFGGHGGGGNVAGPVNEPGTQRARHGKEANKGSRANHNRRDQRARKVAKAGFPA
jgi:activating signal cointegrator complex subunit 2